MARSKNPFGWNSKASSKGVNFQRRGINHARLHLREDFAADAPRNRFFVRRRKTARRSAPASGSVCGESRQAQGQCRAGGSAEAAEAGEVSPCHSGACEARTRKFEIPGLRCAHPGMTPTKCYRTL